MNPGNDNPAARAEFYLCLARAFLPPHTDNDYRALAVYLADDLADLAGEIGYPISEPLAQLRAAFDAVPGSLALLQLYSKLFLTPPMPVALNTGRYLDGAVMGGSVQAIERWYRRHGLERDDSFHDLPDHVVLQLEFVARLFAGAAAAHQVGDESETQRLETEARAFLGTFVAHWLPGFCAALERTPAERRLPAPYLHLARIRAPPLSVTPRSASREPRPRQPPRRLRPSPRAARRPRSCRKSPVRSRPTASPPSTWAFRSPRATRRSGSRGSRRRISSVLAPASAQCPRRMLFRQWAQIAAQNALLGRYCRRLRMAATARGVSVFGGGGQVTQRT